MTYTFQSASACFQDGVLTLKNDCLLARFAVSGGHLELLYLSGSACGLSICADKPVEASSCRFASDDLQGLASPHLSACLSWHDGACTREAHFALFPSLPFIGIRFFADMAYRADKEPLLSCPLPSPHILLKAVTLYDKTDHEDMLVTEDIRPLYKNGGDVFFRGNLFFASDRASGLTLTLVKDSPTFSSAIRHDGFDLIASGSSRLTLVGSGADGTADGLHELYGVTIGLGIRMEQAYRSYFRAMYKGEDRLFIMSNTWGDRSQDSVVSEGFMLNEIDRAVLIGADIVQIDDGWQKGATANSRATSNGVWEGYYAHDPDFWTPHPTRFPHGLEPLAAYARDKGVELGLWFSPDSSDEFRQYQKDIETVLSLWKRFGIRYFKMDGVNLPTKRAETRFIRLLTALTERSGGAIRFNLDITAQNRLGYLYQKSFGTLFVENRYTDWGNYYPHNTLKNLWCLSRYFPAERFQFELLNPSRNIDKYPGDPFAPFRYDIDYMFASVMLANPLLWMELTGLNDENCVRLRRIAAVFRACRDELRHAEVFPIGDMPSGASFTGFQAVTKTGGYLLLFRECTESACFSFSLASPVETLSLLVSNGEPAAVCDGRTLRLTAPSVRTYAIYRYA